MFDARGIPFVLLDIACLILGMCVYLLLSDPELVSGKGCTVHQHGIAIIPGLSNRDVWVVSLRCRLQVSPDARGSREDPSPGGVLMQLCTKQRRLFGFCLFVYINKT